MKIVKVLEILNNHILRLEEELQWKEWEIERLQNEKNGIKEINKD